MFHTQKCVANFLVSGSKTVIQGAKKLLTEKQRRKPKVSLMGTFARFLPYYGKKKLSWTKKILSIT
jgi:hypothetical protein